jgi:hypothetical protein
MKGKHEALRLAVLRPMCPHAVGDCGDVTRIGMIIIDEAQFGLPAPGLENIGDGIEGGSGRGRRVLRVERDNQQPSRAGRA